MRVLLGHACSETRILRGGADLPRSDGEYGVSGVFAHVVRPRDRRRRSSRGPTLDKSRQAAHPWECLRKMSGSAPKRRRGASGWGPTGFGHRSPRDGSRLACGRSESERRSGFEWPIWSSSAGSTRVTSVGPALGDEAQSPREIRGGIAHRSGRFGSQSWGKSGGAREVGGKTGRPREPQYQSAAKARTLPASEVLGSVPASLFAVVTTSRGLKPPRMGRRARGGRPWHPKPT